MLSGFFVYQNHTLDVWFGIPILCGSVMKWGYLIRPYDIGSAAVFAKCNTYYILFECSTLFTTFHWMITAIV